MTIFFLFFRELFNLTFFLGEEENYKIQKSWKIQFDDFFRFYTLTNSCSKNTPSVWFHVSWAPMPNPTTSWARVWSVPRSLRPRLGGSSFSSGKMENCIRLQKRTLKALVLALVKSSLITLTSCWLLSTLQSGNINSIFLGKKKSTFSFLCGFSFNFVQLCQFCNFCSIFQYLIF